MSGQPVYRLDDVECGSFVRRKLHLHIKEGQQELPITRMPMKYYLPLGIVFAVTFVGIAWILIRFTNSNVPWLDSLASCLSIAGV